MDSWNVFVFIILPRGVLLSLLALSSFLSSAGLHPSPPTKRYSERRRSSYRLVVALSCALIRFALSFALVLACLFSLASPLVVYIPLCSFAYLGSHGRILNDYARFVFWPKLYRHNH